MPIYNISPRKPPYDAHAFNIEINSTLTYSLGIDLPEDVAIAQENDDLDRARADPNDPFDGG
jgi:hypothetical protein